MFDLKDKPQPEPEREPAIPELLETYKVSRMQLTVQARELERLRQQVRASAEREAASIVTNARRNVRQVLLDARRELLVLVAQLQAVGCDTPADASPKYIQGETTASSIVPDSGDDAVRDETTNAVVSGARRDVREVLLEAQSELLALAEEARELRARIARQHDGEEIGAAAPGMSEEAMLPTAFPSEDVPQAPPAVPHLVVHDPVDPDNDRVEAADDRVEHSPIEYTPLSSGSRMWVAIAAAVLFAVVASVVYFTSASRSGESQTASAPTAPPSSASQQAAAKATEPPVVPPTPQQAAAQDPSMLSVKVDVRRPAWIRTTIDGRADVGRVFQPGESRTINGREIVMRAGDAGAVFVSVNGAEAKALGGNGLVVTRRFGQPAQAAARPPVLQAASAIEPQAAPAEAPSADVGTTGTRETPPAPAESGAAEREILRSAQQWFEGYFGGDSVTMKHIETADFALVDDRAAAERPAPTTRGIERGLRQMKIDVTGDGAVMSAWLTERASSDTRLREYVSIVSGVWIRVNGQWRLTGMRFVDPGSTGGQ
jgi:hypothetical protein